VLRRPFARWMISRVFTMKNGASMFHTSDGTFDSTFHRTNENPSQQNTTIIDGEFNDESGQARTDPTQSIPGNEDKS
jgi:hypothetical protein